MMQIPTVFTTALLLLFSTAEAEVVGSVTIGTTGEVHNNSFKFFAIQTKVVFFCRLPTFGASLETYPSQATAL